MHFFGFAVSDEAGMSMTAGNRSAIPIAGKCAAANGCTSAPIAWMFAALNAVAPPIRDWATTRLLEGDKTWYEPRLGAVEHRIRDRLGELSVRLGGADWLDGAFNAGDLLMAAVLLRLKASSGIREEYPNLSAYVARGEARPAYKRISAAQLPVVTAKRPTG